MGDGIGGAGGDAAGASLWLRGPEEMRGEKGEAKCEKIPGVEFRNAFRNALETVDT
jgi:hypothetical protein